MYMCTVLLPPGGYPIAVKYIISGSGKNPVTGCCEQGDEPSG